jgi:hypothetical protein
MSAALQPTTARQSILETVIDQLVPLYAQIYDGKPDIARQAAVDAMDPYWHDEAADLAVAGQIVACGLATMRVLQMCMKPDATPADLARLCRTADTLSRTEQRHRVSGLYPASPKPVAKPAATRGATVHSLPVKAPPTPPTIDEPPPANAQRARADFMMDFQVSQPEAAPGSTSPAETLTHEDYCEIYRASRDGRLGRIMAGNPGLAERELIDRVRAASFADDPAAPPRT